MTSCWHCSQPRAPEDALCPHCGKVQPPPALRPGERQVRDKFRVLGLERAYDLDEKALEQRYRDLSRKLHPDRFARAGPQERRFSLEQTTLVNDAFRTLKDPVRRAEHLLELRGVHLAEEGRVAGGEQKKKLEMAPEFLEQAMEDREALLEAKMSGDAGEVRRLADRVRRSRDETMEEVAGRLRALERGEPRDLDEIARLLARLRYHARFLDEVEGRAAEI